MSETLPVCLGPKGFDSRRKARQCRTGAQGVCSRAAEEWGTGGAYLLKEQMRQRKSKQACTQKHFTVKKTKKGWVVSALEQGVPEQPVRQQLFPRQYT